MTKSTTALSRRSHNVAVHLETLNHDQKNPILLRSHSLFTDLFILKFHEKCCHSGVNATLNLLRTKFWIIRGSQTVKKYLKKCVTCKIVQGKTLKPPDCPSLPKFQLECNHAFENVGLDYAGPLFIKEKGNAQKYYILLFTCAVTRAIHLELCTNVSAMVLILAISRFASRRGLPKLFVSDNFKSFKSTELRNFLLKGGIKWRFILEKLPWWVVSTNV